MTPSQWAAISNAFLPFDPVPPDKVEQWFVERPGGAFKYLARRFSPERIPQRYILVGQPASGKSSELIKLAAELRKQYNALVVLFDMTDHIDVEQANPVEAAVVLGQVGQGNAEVLTTLFTLLQEQGESEWVRRGSALALGQVRQRNAEVVDTLLMLVRGEKEPQVVCDGIAVALGQVGPESAEILTTLLTLLREQIEDEEMRHGAVQALGQVGEGNKQIIQTLLMMSREPSVRKTTRNALWEVVEGGGGNEV